MSERERQREECLCKEHSGILVRIEKVEGGVTDLWHKWDKMQTCFVTILVLLIVNLLGVIGILAR